MKMELIVICGPKGVGKSVVIDDIHKDLIAIKGYKQVANEYYKFPHDTNGVDFRDILTSNGGLTVGVLSEGDYARRARHLSVKNHLDYFKSKQCDIVLCAWQDTIPRIEKSINRYKNTKHPKTAATNSDNSFVKNAVLKLL